MDNLSMLIAAAAGALAAVLLLWAGLKSAGFRLVRQPKRNMIPRDFDFTQVDEPATQQFEDPRDDPPTQQLR